MVCVLADAGMVGNTLGLDEAYRLARGEEVSQSHELKLKLVRPLDLLATGFGIKVHDLVKAGKGPDAYNLWLKALKERKYPLKNNKIFSTMWQRQTSDSQSEVAISLNT